MLKNLAIGAIAFVTALLPISGVAFAATTGTNLINNADVELSTAGAPTGWNKTSWSTNTKNLTYENTGHTGSHSLKTEITTLGTGADGWYFDPISVTAGQTYELSFWYQSNVDFEVDADIMAGTVETTPIVGNVTASTSWAQYKTTFTAAANETVTMTAYLTKVGYVTTDDYSFSSYTATPLSQPIVSVTFDDGWVNQYANGRQVLLDNGIHATFYLISQELQKADGVTSDYMTVAQATTLLNDGNEIGSHTIDHCSLTGTTKGTNCQDPSTMTTAAAAQFVTDEMTTSKNTIQSLIPGAAINNFAYPYGEYNTQTTTIGTGLYTSQRTVECANNTLDSLDLAKLKGCEVDASVSVAQAEAWIDSAIAQKSWLVLFFHEIANQGQGVAGDEAYTTSVTDFTTIMQYIKAKQTQGSLTNMTVAQAIAAVKGTTPVTKAGDLNADGKVNALDLSTLLANWAKTGATAPQGDLNGDATVNALDLSTLLANWSK